MRKWSTRGCYTWHMSAFYTLMVKRWFGYSISSTLLSVLMLLMLLVFHMHKSGMSFQAEHIKNIKRSVQMYQWRKVPHIKKKVSLLLVFSFAFIQREIFCYKFVNGAYCFCCFGRHPLLFTPSDSPGVTLVPWWLSPQCDWDCIWKYKTSLYLDEPWNIHLLLECIEGTHFSSFSRVLQCVLHDCDFHVCLHKFVCHG